MIINCVFGINTTVNMAINAEKDGAGIELYEKPGPEKMNPRSIEVYLNANQVRALIAVLQAAIKEDDK